MMQVTIEQAYQEACTALGEAVVRERLLIAQLSKLTAEGEAGSATD